MTRIITTFLANPDHRVKFHYINTDFKSDTVVGTIRNWKPVDGSHCFVEFNHRPNHYYSIDAVFLKPIEQKSILQKRFEFARKIAADQNCPKLTYLCNWNYQRQINTDPHPKVVWRDKSRLELTMTTVIPGDVQRRETVPLRPDNCYVMEVTVANKDVSASNIFFHTNEQKPIGSGRPTWL